MPLPFSRGNSAVCFMCANDFAVAFRRKDFMSRRYCGVFRQTHSPVLSTRNSMMSTNHEEA